MWTNELTVEVALCKTIVLLSNQDMEILIVDFILAWLLDLVLDLLF